MDEKVIVSKEDFDLEDMKEHLTTSSDMAVVSFVEIVGDTEKGDSTKKMEVQRYEGMTLEQLQRVRDETINNFDITDIVIHHRCGNFLVGDNIVGIMVSSEDRKEAFAACRYCIDRTREVVPFWKKETTEKLHNHL